jgi:starch phosphorylase
VADVVNHDPRIHGLLKVVFIPNYDVSTAGDIIPAADLSEQISTAGTEASGTGNMKLSLNGALTIGTMDGANVEICAAVGEENMFVFGLDREQEARLREEGYDPMRYVQASAALANVLRKINDGYFSQTQLERHRPVVDSLVQGDRYFVCADFEAYVAAQERVAELYRQPEEWSRRAILNVARMGRFSSDRAVHEYAERVWNVKPVIPK